eukprot:COSAG03_NODE_3196_length_2149_cov_2.769756_2_plen_52_part_00
MHGLRQLGSLSEDERARVEEYIAQEFAYEEALDQRGGVYADAPPVAAAARL